MQVNPVSVSNQAFRSDYQDLVLQGIASLNDEEIRYFAKEKTLSDVQDRKHRMIDKALWYSTPVAGGIAAAAVPTIVKPTRIGRLIEFSRGFGGWATPLLVGLGVSKGISSLAKSSDTVNNFNKKHPFLSNLAYIFAAYGTYLGVNKLGTELISKYGLGFADKYSEQISKFSKNLETNKILNAISQKVKSMPNLAKNITKSGLKIAPWALLVAGFIHMVNHNAKKTNYYVNNYQDMKNLQAMAQDYMATQNEEV